MSQASPKPFRTAREIRAELDWAAQVLTRDDSPSRITFALPEPIAVGKREQAYTWDVLVRCRPDQDAAAQAAITYVADKWDLTDTLAARLHDLAEIYREGAEAARRDQSTNPYANDEAKQKAWAAGAAGSLS